MSILSGLLPYKEIFITNKKEFFLKKQSTKEGTWGYFDLEKGELDFIFLNGNNEEIDCQHIDKKNPHLIIPPSCWHKIKLINKREFSANINFYCIEHRYFEKKYKLNAIQSDVLYTYKNYIPEEKILNILDIGCGSGRNLLYFALNNHKVTGIDINQEALHKVEEIAKNEKLTKINTFLKDLNQPINLTPDYYNFIFSTVTLQFLNEKCIKPLLTNLQVATVQYGIHLLVFPIEQELFQWPLSFTFLAKEKQLYEIYQDAGWAILEYKEAIGKLHKTDKSGRPIQGKFGTLIAKKIH